VDIQSGRFRQKVLVGAEKVAGVEAILQGYHRDPDMPHELAAKRESAFRDWTQRIDAQIGRAPTIEDFRKKPGLIKRLLGSKGEIDRAKYTEAVNQRAMRFRALPEHIRKSPVLASDYAASSQTGKPIGGKGLANLLLSHPQVDEYLTDKNYGDTPVSRNLSADQVRKFFASVPQEHLHHSGLSHADIESALKNRRAKMFRLEMR